MLYFSTGPKDACWDSRESWIWDSRESWIWDNVNQFFIQFGHESPKSVITPIFVSKLISGDLNIFCLMYIYDTGVAGNFFGFLISLYEMPFLFDNTDCLPILILHLVFRWLLYIFSCFWVV